jgi:hypothetical protein
MSKFFENHENNKSHETNLKNFERIGRSGKKTIMYSIKLHRAFADVRGLTNGGDRGGILDCVFSQLALIDEEISSVLLIPSRFCHFLST